MWQHILHGLVMIKGYNIFNWWLLLLGLHLLLIILFLLSRIIFNIDYCADYFPDELIHCLVYEMSLNCLFFLTVQKPKHNHVFYHIWKKNKEKKIINWNYWNSSQFSDKQLINESTNCFSSGNNNNIVTWNVNVTTQLRYHELIIYSGT